MPDLPPLFALSVKGYALGGMLQEQTDLYDPETGTGLAVLVQRCAEGDTASFRQLYDEQSARLNGIALRITRQPALAAEVVHDSFVSVWQFAGSFDPTRGSPEAWLTSIVRHRALDMVRRRGHEITGMELPDQADQEPDPLARLAGSAEGAELRRCLGELEEDKRSLIAMAFMNGYSHTQLAAKLGIPLGTVKSSVRRGLASLRRCLEAA
jgi:RNA polymerase sigma-70 factor, ECF subfamily